MERVISGVGRGGVKFKGRRVKEAVEKCKV